MALFGKGLPQDDVDRDEYETKPLTDDGEEDHDEVPQREIYTLSRSLRRTNLFMKVVIGLQCFMIIALLSINVPDTVKKIKSTKAFTPSLVPNPVPNIPMQRTTFEKHPLYSQRPNELSDEAWNKLLPDGRGFVYVPDWKKYDYPAGQETEYGMIYSVALFHQMHCLGQLRRFTWMFLDAISNNDTEAMDKVKDMFAMDHMDHMNHCFDYLRQSIACSGDMTMEWPRTEADGRRFAVDGWGIPHECKNWGNIMEYMNETHFDHSTNDQIAPLVGSSG